MPRQEESRPTPGKEVSGRGKGHTARRNHSIAYRCMDVSILDRVHALFDTAATLAVDMAAEAAFTRSSADARAATNLLQAAVLIWDAGADDGKESAPQ